jgi:hypothetical protein
MPNVSLILGIMGGMCLMGSTANIDTGDVNGDWHTTFANAFFIITILAAFYNTFINIILYFNGKIISKWSFYSKIVYLILSIIQIYIQAFYASIHNIDKIIEFTMTFTLLYYFFIIGNDLKKFNLCYKLF